MEQCSARGATSSIGAEDGWLYTDVTDCLAEMTCYELAAHTGQA